MPVPKDAPQPRRPAAPRPVVWVLGPPAARRQRLIEARLAAVGEGIGTGLWIAEDAAAANETKASLVEAAGTGLLAPGVKTLSQVADTLIAETSQRFHPLGPVHRRRIVSDLVERGRRRHSFEPLRPLSETPGLIDYLVRRFGQLRRLGLGSEDARDRLRQSEGRVGGALAPLYEDYLAALEDQRLLDAEGRFALASERLDEGSGRWRHLAIDLVRPLCPAETRFVCRLAGRADETWLSLPGDSGSIGSWEAADKDSPLPAATARAAAWAAALGAPGEILQAEPGKTIPPALRTLRESLFDPSLVGSTPEPAAEGFRVLVGAHRADEARRAARCVKQMLVEGELPGGIVLGCRNLASESPRLADALAEYGVPFSIDLKPSLGDAPVAAALRGLLRTADSDWGFHPLLETLARCDLSQLAQSRRQRASTEWFVRELQAPRGRSYLLKQAANLAERGERPDHEASSLERHARLANETLTRLDEALAATAIEAPPLAWLEVAWGLLRKLGYGQANSPEAIRLDRAARETLESSLAAEEQVARWRGEPPPLLTRRELLALLDAWSTRLPLSVPRSNEGRVRVVSAESAAGLRCEHLVVVDMSEESFSAKGEASDLDGAHPSEPSLLLHELIGRPEKSLTFTYTALDGAGQPLPPSPYLADAQRLFADNAAEPGRSLLGVVDPDEPPLSVRELRLRAVASNDPERLAEALRTDERQRLSAPLAAIASRGSGERFGPYEGILGAPARAELQQRFGPSHAWSPTQLEAYAECPFKFFARHALGAEPIEQLDLDLDYRRRGSLTHDALAACCAELASLAGEGGRLSDLADDDVVARLTAHLRRLSLDDRLPAHEAAMAAIEAEQAVEWARGYPDQQRDYDQKWNGYEEPLRPQMFEARFGPARRTDEHEDPASTDKPLELPLPGGETLRVVGRIDRIDVGRHNGQTLFAVIDYKTGKRVRAKREELESGRQLQLALYAVAAQELLLDGALPVGAGYWAVQGKGFLDYKGLGLTQQAGGRLEASDEWRATIDRLSQTLREIVDGVRAGAFPMSNPVEDCGRNCDYSAVCRVAHARSLGKGDAAPTGDAS